MRGGGFVRILLTAALLLATAACVPDRNMSPWTPWSGGPGHLALSNFRFEHANIETVISAAPDCSPVPGRRARRFRPAVQGDAGDPGRARQRCVLAPPDHGRAMDRLEPRLHRVGPIDRRAALTLFVHTLDWAAMSSRRDLFPPIEPYRTGRLRLDSVHAMYWEECGNPHGVPALFLHGGPGAGATPVHRRFFDPAYWRIVIFDQRGAGRSTPLGEVRDNSPDQLVADIERLRVELGIERWLVFGGSWGSTLALLYAETHPERCAGVILRGIFLARAAEIDWFLYGIAAVFPEAWRAFSGFIPEAERGDLLAAYYRRLIDPDPRVHMPAARAWSLYEGACSTLLPNPETIAAFGEDRLALGLARIEAHFFTRYLFSGADDLLARIGLIRHLPAVIVQGRYDMVCPIRSADELARAWPEAEYVIVPDAGHSAMEPGIREQLVLATERLKR